MLLLYFGHFSSSDAPFIAILQCMSRHGSYARVLERAGSTSLLTVAGVGSVTFHSHDILLTTTWPYTLHNKKIFGREWVHCYIHSFHC